MSKLSIGDVARRTGIRPSALRYYEEVGLLPRTPRAGGRRRYGEQAVRMVEVLRVAQQAGFTLDEIRQLFHRFDAKARLGDRWRLLAEAKLRELDAQIAVACADFTRCRLVLRRQAFDRVGDPAIAQRQDVGPGDRLRRGPEAIRIQRFVEQDAGGNENGESAAGLGRGERQFGRDVRHGALRYLQ